MKKFFVFLVLLVCVGITAFGGAKISEDIRSKEDLTFQKQNAVTVQEAERSEVGEQASAALSDNDYYDIEFQTVLSENEDEDSGGGEE